MDHCYLDPYLYSRSLLIHPKVSVGNASKRKTGLNLFFFQGESEDAGQQQPQASAPPPPPMFSPIYAPPTNAYPSLPYNSHFQDQVSLCVLLL